MKTVRILAVDPGSRTMGVAFLEGKELVYYGVKTVKPFQGRVSIYDEVRRVVTNLIAFYQPTVLVVEKVSLPQNTASPLISVIREIKKPARRAGIAVFEYSPKIVKDHLCQTKRGTRSDTARKLVAAYPELARYLESRSRWEEDYYAKLFAAVAVGVYHLEEISTQQG